VNDQTRKERAWPGESPRVVAVRPLDGYRLELKFHDGTAGVVDLNGWLIGAGGVFAPLENADFFRQVRLSTEGGTIEWPNGVDLCPDVLYSRATGIPIPFAEQEHSAPTKIT
jgi:hypothetical protein